MAADGTRPVEMLEEGAAGRHGAAPAVADQGAPGSPEERRRRRVVAVAGAALAVALVAVAAAVTVTQQRDEARRRAELEALGWVLPTLDGPLEEAWRTSAGWPVTVTDRVVVLADTAGLGLLTAVDLGTGAVVWERRPTGPTEGCTAAAPTGDSDAASGPPRGGVLVCVPATNEVRGAPVPGLVTRVVAVDPDTGAELAARDVAGSVLLRRGVGDDVVVGYVHDDGALGLVRWSPQVDELRWTYRGDPGLLPDGRFGAWGYRVTEGVLTLQGTDRVAVDLGTGAAVAPDEADLWLERHALPDGARAFWHADAGGVVLDGRVVDGDGERFALPGVPWVGDQDDGSDPGILVVQEAAESGLVGLDAGTGERVWELPGRYWAWAPLRLDGRAVAEGPGQVVLLDLDDGAVVWRRQAAVTTPAVLTDGRLVLVPVTIRGRGYLAALELGSGVEAWRVPAPVDVVEVRVAGPVVLLVGEAKVVALRVPGPGAEG